MVLLSFMLNEAALNWHGWAGVIQRRRRYTMMNWWRYVLYAACHSKSHTRQKEKRKKYIKVMRKKSRKYNNKFGMAWPVCVCVCFGRYQLSRAVHTMRKATPPAFDEFRGFLCRNQKYTRIYCNRWSSKFNKLGSVWCGWFASVCAPQSTKCHRFIPSAFTIAFNFRISFCHINVRIASFSFVCPSSTAKILCTFNESKKNNLFSFRYEFIDVTSDSARNKEAIAGSHTTFTRQRKRQTAFDTINHSMINSKNGIHCAKLFRTENKDIVIFNGNASGFSARLTITINNKIGSWMHVIYIVLNRLVKRIERQLHQVKCAQYWSSIHAVRVTSARNINLNK